MNGLNRWLFDPSGLTPHGFCLLWQPGLIWTYAVADFMTGAAYFTISLALVVFVHRRRDLMFRRLFWLFAAFILLCGVTHWLDLLTLWVAAYGVQGLVKASTAAVSVVTAVILWRLLPQALALPSPAQLHAAHKELRKSEEFLDSTGRVAGIGGWERNLVTGEIFWSAETCRLLGVEPSFKPTREAAFNFYSPEAIPAIRVAIERAVAGGGGWDMELPFIRADGRPIWARSVGTAEFVDGKPIRLVGAFQDITGRVAERVALENVRERFALATHAGRVGIWDWDVVNDQMFWDPWMFRLYGIEVEGNSASYELWARHLHPDDRFAVEQAVRNGVEGTKPYDAEFRVVWSDGSVHHLQASGRVTRDSTGRAVRMVGTNWDVTESRQLAAELARQAELQIEAGERERALFLNSPDSLFVVRVEDTASGPTFVYEAFSPAFITLTGMRTEDVIGHSPEACLPPEISRLVIPRYRRCVEEASTIKYVGTYPLPIGTRDVEGSITPIQNPITGKVVRLVGAMRDVTERNKMEKALQAAQKMEALGRLSAGVAHDFNNILQSIVGGLEHILDEVKEHSPAYEFADVAINSAMRGSSLTHHLLSYARKQMLRPEAFELSPLLSEIQTLLSRTIGPQIDILVRTDQKVSLLADPGQLQTALLNLAINASHAMPEGGTLSIDARAVTEAGQNWVVISLTDTGMGMDPATLAQAVEPFFTTKGLEGSGLGLSMVQGFAEQSGGSFGITSTLGLGTTVELRLPSATSISRAEVLERSETRRASGRILLVDDAPDVLATTGAFLEKVGFFVVRAGSGEKALVLLDEGERFDALVSDYAMPGMNGADLIAAAQTVQPGLKALLITGYAGDGYTVALPEGTPVLHKPFQRSDLIEALRQVMDSGQDTVGERASAIWTRS